MITKFLKKLYLFLILLFLYAPIIVLIVLSFNESKSRSKWGGFSFKWYEELFQNETIINALSNTLTIALLSAFISTIIALFAVIGIQKMNKTLKNVFMGISNIPMLNADIVTGISMMLLFIASGITLNYSTVLISHITFNIPYVMLSIMPRYNSMNPSVYEAALDLGASPVKAFTKVVLPDIFPGIMSGFLLAFTMSLDDFVITYFTMGRGFDTLSTMIYSQVKKGIKPEIYSLSTILFAGIFILLILINKIPGQKEDNNIEKNRV